MKKSKPTLEDLVKIAHESGMRLSVDLLPMPPATARCMYVDPKTLEPCPRPAEFLFKRARTHCGIPVCGICVRIAKTDHPTGKLSKIKKGKV
jgi:hypothetical protein